MAFDVEKIRKDFPILSRQVRGKPLIYLDSAATSQKPTVVIEALSRFYRECNSNIHRGVHALAEEAERHVDETRRKTMEFIGAKSTSSVIFTRNTTESINLVAYAWGRKFLKEGDEILLTELEHHSNLIPWQMLAKEKGVRLGFVPIEKDGSITLEAARGAFTPRTKLFAFTAMSNALGTIVPVREFCALARGNGAVSLVDGAQWVPHLKTDVGEFGCDFLAFSAHKMLGPTGLGVLYGNETLLDAMDPFLGGGDMIQDVWYDRATFNKLPYKFEAGTPNIADTAAFSAALDYLGAIGFDDMRRHEELLTRRAMEILEAEPCVTSFGPKEAERRGGVVSFNVGDLHPHDVGQVFDMDGIAVRVGHHCCQPLMRKFDVGGTARASFYFYNTLEEVEAFGRGLRRIKEFFKIGTEVKV
ncbi:MAG: cysteine desulfurase [Elusimicrobiota bacterium]